ncbi:protein-disulfide reductase DsbD [Caldimonas sp. KR1-144]|uniref:protein-disulfide reductase DsbD n=1 Tax=Caldimonas sp. KR1-144 TaxID=3400911 RepID=UPI003C0F3671
MLAALLVLLFLALAARAADDFLPPEQAFKLSAVARDERTVELRFEAADGYYLYREQFKFAATDAAVRLGAIDLPRGKVKYDETFEKDVETLRGAIVVAVPVEAAPARFALQVTNQGCADQGLCYPPQTREVSVSLAGFGGDGKVALGGPAGGGPLAGLTTAAPAATATVAVDINTGDGRIDAALRGGRWWSVVAVFFAAGVLLSFTPCVLPMLPILSSLIVGGGHAASRGRGLGLAASYSLGMALVYTALGVAAGLAGEGLAAALQTPWVLTVFALLMALLSLSMFGFYELQLPSAWQARLSGTANRVRGGHLAGVFVMGGLSALIVSPCVAAPLAGALLYISQSRDVMLGGGALFALAAGMSVPLLLIGASAGALLPRAGAWMESVKRFFGLLLLGVAVWMISPVVAPPVVLLLWGAWLLLAACLLHPFSPSNGGASRPFVQALGVLLGIGALLQLAGAAAGANDPLKPLAPFTGIAAMPAVPATAGGAGAKSSAPAAAAPHGVSFRRIRNVAELDAALRSAGRPVMLDFYADWCVSCKEMERFTFSDTAIRARLEKALLLQADVTANSADDKALLARFKLFGPPGIVFFDAQGREQAQRVIGFQNTERFGKSLEAVGL